MGLDAQPASVPKWMLWTGWIISGLLLVMFVMGAVMKLAKPEFLVTDFDRLGWAESLALSLGILELVCAIVYAIPRTAILGAILLTGYLGGAIATHVRIGDPFFAPIILGVLVWGALYLRDPRLRALVPLRGL